MVDDQREIVSVAQSLGLVVSPGNATAIEISRDS